MKITKNKIVSDDNFIKKGVKNNKFLYKNLIKTKYNFNRAKVDKIRKGNIVVFHNGRVGSTVLASLLNQHSKIQWDGELFVKRGIYNQHFRDMPIEFLRQKTYQYKTEFYVFELKSMPNQHLGKDELNMTFDDFMKILNDFNFKYYINIKRKNYIKQYISLERVIQKNIIHTDKKINKGKIKIDVNKTRIGLNFDTMLNNFRLLDEHYVAIESKIKSKKSLFLTYEDDILPNPLIAYRKICNLLEIKPENPTIELKRTNPYPIKDMVENYSEICEIIKNTKYEWMLDD